MQITHFLGIFNKKIHETSENFKEIKVDKFKAYLGFAIAYKIICFYYAKKN